MPYFLLERSTDFSNWFPNINTNQLKIKHLLLKQFGL
jgi:hypothetical protein